MITPSGRFQVNSRLCLSMSDFHPESWNPLWSVSSILSGLLSFMVEETPTHGSVSRSPADRRRLAARSMTFNRKDPVFVETFPDLVEAAADGSIAPPALPPNEAALWHEAYEQHQSGAGASSSVDGCGGASGGRSEDENEVTVVAVIQTVVLAVLVSGCAVAIAYYDSPLDALADLRHIVDI
ncbi:ubiquitin carrier protein E2 34 [Thecamonas trahens ATCC 50062]|uniref:Ubiquitin carrier protein E2 34 n=1 Tax=Thecamonas trahens ATCC 50062 TaxID=461836 RepID=A0A0L0DGZ2_THETB|nr:ubiquitin carrier protein E2 34 [Thecamonas trahens ATCC 50062]KNC51485.1 ubiquitin carrier protein E2 34 [Thecamonas trahens ATCC 50062]|eukprot:XP_013756144.1 ubiquitin carrier protein E2 34 [Thecamonas trahens ATCC 50062]